jgi:hypothetical protein
MRMNCPRNDRHPSMSLSAVTPSARSKPDKHGDHEIVKVAQNYGRLRRNGLPELRFDMQERDA